MFGLIILSSSILNKKNEDDQSEEKGVVSDMEILDVTRENFEEEVLKADRKVLVDFYADWCGPCRRMGEVLEDLDEINVLKINTDEFPKIATSFGVMSIPTLILFIDGAESGKLIGLQSKDDILDFVNKR